MKKIYSKNFDFGKIDYFRTGRKINAVTVEINIHKCGGDPIRNRFGETIPGETTPVYLEFSAVCFVWNARKTDICAGGQCFDELKHYLFGNRQFMAIYKLWQNWHLNGMQAGTPEQENAVNDWIRAGNKYDYTAVSEYLKNIGLFEVNYTGLTVGRVYNNEPYKYGHGWIVKTLPADVIETIRTI